MKLKGKKICRVSTVPFFINTQLRSQIKATIAEGARITVVSSPGKLIDTSIPFVEIPIRRKISVLHDLVTLYRLYVFFKKEKFDLIHSATPKAGLLCALAGGLAFVPIRIHTFTGQTLVESTGIKRWLLISIDKLITKLNTSCYVDSPSQLKYLHKHGIGRRTDIKCVGSGSVAGVDLKRFDFDKYAMHSSNERKSLGISLNSFVFLFLGRVTFDKGIRELVSAFSRLREDSEDIQLIIAGPIEDDTQDYINSLDIPMTTSVHFTGHVSCPEKYLAISNVMVLPSYREGFGTVVLEAAAMRTPTIGSRIYGLEDAIKDKETGLIVDVKSVESLYQAMRLLLLKPEFGEQLGKQAFERVKSLFSSTYVDGLVVREYEKLFESANSELPTGT